MPKSKRNKLVHLTQVKKKGKDHKEELMKQLEQYATSYERMHLFDFDSVKSDRIMALRVKLKTEGRIFSGKNSLLQHTLTSVAKKRKGASYEDFLSNVTGHKGVLFTNLKRESLLEKLDKEIPEFCKRLQQSAELNSTKATANR